MFEEKPTLNQQLKQGGNLRQPDWGGAWASVQSREDAARRQERIAGNEK